MDQVAPLSDQEPCTGEEQAEPSESRHIQGSHDVAQPAELIQQN